MILVVESGATKTDWRAVTDDGTGISVRTAGMNLAVMDEDAVEKIVEDAARKFGNEGLDFNSGCELHFYAAGLVVLDNRQVPELARHLDCSIRKIFNVCEIEYASDLLGAARAVCGKEPGIAAILGTGSNSCLFDGNKIVRNVRTGGFILGDEGGGARLGKMFIADYIKGLVPKEISEDFSEEYHVTYMDVVANVYRGETPSKYLGGFAPWIMARYGESGYVREIADRNFADFIERALKQYDLEKYSVGVVGGFGYAYREIFEKVAAQYGVRISGIIPDSAERLVAYHCGSFPDKNI